MFKTIIHDKSGNFGIMTGLLIPLLLGVAGLAIDFSTAVLTKDHLQSIADATSLSAASRLARKELSVAEARADAIVFAKAQLQQLNTGVVEEDFDVLITPLSKPSGQVAYDVTTSLSASVPTTLSRIFGHEELKVAVVSDANSETPMQPSLSLYLVLDRSGSMQASVTSSIDRSRSACSYYFMNSQQTAMYRTDNYRPCYFQRIEVMKTAVGDLMKSLAEEDPKEMFIRTGATAFSSSKFPPQALNWKPANVTTHVKAMWPEGGTSSTKAFEEAVNSLTSSLEDTAHLAKNGQTPTKYILFMTDGENNAASDNSATLSQCSKAKSAGVRVYTVGFMLLSNTAKEFLKQCATDSTTYFDATDGQKLTEAFAKIAQITKGATPRLTN